LVRLLDMYGGEDLHLDAVLPDRLGDAGRPPGGGHARVGDEKGAPRAVPGGEVVPDLRSRARAELQVRRAVGEHRFGRHAGTSRCPSADRITSGTSTGRRDVASTYTCTKRPTAAGSSPRSGNSASRHSSLIVPYRPISISAHTLIH